jgi:hypothetical protein
MVGTWKDCRKVLGVASLICGGVAAGIPDVWSKVLFAVALGLSNAAIYIKAEEQ